MTKIKICGLQTIEDAQMCMDAGVDAVGFVFAPSKRQISAQRAQQIASILPPFIARVGVFVDTPREEVEEIAKEVGLTVLQFHGSEDADYCSGFTIPIIKAIRVQTKEDLTQASKCLSAAVLLDTYHPLLLGGTGLHFDWSLVDEKLPIPIILAGGLHDGNVASAIRIVQPYAVDVSSGVETDGRKDPFKISAFTKAVRRCG